jgi:hypothetical protein
MCYVCIFVLTWHDNDKTRGTSVCDAATTTTTMMGMGYDDHDDNDAQFLEMAQRRGIRDGATALLVAVHGDDASNVRIARQRRHAARDARRPRRRLPCARPRPICLSCLALCNAARGLIRRAASGGAGRLGRGVGMLRPPSAPSDRALRQTLPPRRRSACGAFYDLSGVSSPLGAR